MQLFKTPYINKVQLCLYYWMQRFLSFIIKYHQLCNDRTSQGIRLCDETNFNIGSYVQIETKWRLHFIILIEKKQHDWKRIDDDPIYSYTTLGLRTLKT